MPLNAEITAATLEAIFTVPGPLHDGAVIISNNKIAAAAVILPITEREELGYVLGTRHRAAIGISEQSDAIVLVVSEETRAISFVYGGHIRRGLTAERPDQRNWSASTGARSDRANTIAGRATATPKPSPPTPPAPAVAPAPRPIHAASPLPRHRSAAACARAGQRRARWIRARSASTSAAMASTMGTARGSTQGSCRPRPTRSTGTPS